LDTLVTPGRTRKARRSVGVQELLPNCGDAAPPPPIWISQVCDNIE
jgi:hypothetical protein